MGPLVLIAFGKGFLLFWWRVTGNVIAQGEAFSCQLAVEATAGKGKSLVGVALAGSWGAAEDTFAKHVQIAPFFKRVVEHNVRHGS